MLGSLAAVNVLPFKSEALLESIINNIPDNYKEINKKSFYGGTKAIKS